MKDNDVKQSSSKKTFFQRFSPILPKNKKAKKIENNDELNAERNFQKLKQISNEFSINKAKKLFPGEPFWQIICELAEEELKNHPLDKTEKRLLKKIKANEEKEESSKKNNALDTGGVISKERRNNYGATYINLEKKLLWQNVVKLFAVCYEYYAQALAANHSLAPEIEPSDLTNFINFFKSIFFDKSRTSTEIGKLFDSLAVFDSLSALSVICLYDYSTVDLTKENTKQVVKNYLNALPLETFALMSLADHGQPDNLLSGNAGKRTELTKAYIEFRKELNDNNNSINSEKREKFYFLCLAEVDAIKIYSEKIIKSEATKKITELLEKQQKIVTSYIENFKHNHNLKIEEIAYLVQFLDSFKGVFYYATEINLAITSEEFLKTINNKEEHSKVISKTNLIKAYANASVSQTLMYQSYIETHILGLDNKVKTYNTAKDYAVRSIKELIEAELNSEYNASLSINTASQEFINTNNSILESLTEILSYYNNTFNISDTVQIEKAKKLYEESNEFKNFPNQNLIDKYPRLLNILTKNYNFDQIFTLFFTTTPNVIAARSEPIYVSGGANEGRQYFRDWIRAESDIRIFKEKYLKNCQLLKNNNLTEIEFQNFLQSYDQKFHSYYDTQKIHINEALSLIKKQKTEQSITHDSLAKAAELGKSLGDLGMAVEKEDGVNTNTAKEKLIRQLEAIKNPEAKITFILSLTAQILKLTEEAAGQETLIYGLEKGVLAFAELANETLKFLKKQSNPDILLPEVSLGVGLVLEKNENGFVIIEEPGLDTPAYKAGLRKGQKITGIEKGNPAVKLEVNADTAFQEIANLVRITEKNNDNPDLPVKITVEKAAGQSETHEITSRKIIHFNKDHHSKTYNLNDAAINANINLTKELEPYLNKVLKELEVGKPKIIQSSKDICL